jgi:hypothetical protein
VDAFACSMLAINLPEGRWLRAERGGWICARAWDTSLIDTLGIPAPSIRKTKPLAFLRSHGP